MSCLKNYIFIILNELESSPNLSYFAYKQIGLALSSFSISQSCLGYKQIAFFPAKQEKLPFQHFTFAQIDENLVSRFYFQSLVNFSFQNLRKYNNLVRRRETSKMVFLNNGQLEFVEAITTSFSFDFDFVDIVVIKLSYAILFNETAVQNLPIIRNELVGLQRISDLISHCSLFVKVISGCFCTRQTLLHHKIKSIYEDSFIYRIYIIFMNLTKINKVLILNARFLFISTSSHYLYCLIYFSFQFLQLIFFGQRFFFQFLNTQKQTSLKNNSSNIKPAISIIFIKIQKNISNMADFPQDLNYGVTLGDPQPKIGTGYNPPKVNNNSASKTDEEAAQSGNSDKYNLKKAAHPNACIATFIFKALAFLFYFIPSSIIQSTIITFILVILLCSLDFWVVKNVTGRLLVGLRWWSQIDSKGKEVWRFENPSKDRVINKVDSAFFWTSQLAATAAWGVFLLINILTFSIFLAFLLSICTSLSGTNLYAYYLCRGDHKKKVADLKKEGIKMFLSNAM